MKMITKNFSRALAVFLLLTFLVPASALAAQSREPRPTDSAKDSERPAVTRTAAVCERLDGFLSKLGQNLGNANSRLSDVKKQRTESLKERGEKNDERLNEVRHEGNGNRKDHYQKLRERAQNAEQEQAVEDFIDAVEAAVRVRKAAVDAAIEAYRKGLADASKTRTVSTETARKNFEAAIKTAQDQARTDCQTMNSATVRARLLTALQEARKQLQADIRAANQIQTTLRGLKEARREAVKQAFDDFKTAFQAALADLKAAFETTGDDSPDSSTEDDSE